MSFAKTKAAYKIQNLVRNNRTKKLMKKVSNLSENELKNSIYLSIMKNEKLSIEGFFELLEYKPTIKEIIDYLNKNKTNPYLLIDKNLFKKMYDNIFEETNESVEKFIDIFNNIFYRINKNDTNLNNNINNFIHFLINKSYENSNILDSKGYDILFENIIKILESKNIKYNKENIIQYLLNDYNDNLMNHIDIFYYIIKNIKKNTLNKNIINSIIDKLNDLDLDDDNDFYSDKIKELLQ